MKKVFSIILAFVFISVSLTAQNKEALVYFTRDISADSVVRLYEKVENHALKTRESGKQPVLYRKTSDFAIIIHFSVLSLQYSFRKSCRGTEE